MSNHDAVCRRVEQIIAKWRPRMAWLHEFELKISPIPWECDDYEMSVQYTSFSFTAEFLVQPQAAKLSRKELERTVLHELTHILLHEMGMAHRDTSPANPAYENAEERVCWRVAKMLLP